MAMKIEELVREFKYNSVPLADPNPTFTLAQVRDFYSGVYPEILNAEIEGPDVKGNKQVYTFRRAVGTKGHLSNFAFMSGAGDFSNDQGNRRFCVYWSHESISKKVDDLVALMQIGWFTAEESLLIQELQEHIATPDFFVYPSTQLLKLCSHVIALHEENCNDGAVLA